MASRHFCEGNTTIDGIREFILSQDDTVNHKCQCCNNSLWAQSTCDRFLFICSFLKKSNSQSCAEKAARLLNALFTTNSLERSFYIELFGSAVDCKESVQHRMCGHFLLELPDLVSSQCLLENFPVFDHENFFHRLSVSIIDMVLTEQHIKDFSLVGEIIGKLCRREMKCWKPLFREIFHQNLTSKICWKLTSACSDEYMDSFVMAALSTCPNWKLIHFMLSKLVIERRDLCRRLFFHKLIAGSYFESNQFVCNLIGCFVGAVDGIKTSGQLDELLNELVCHLVNLWCDPVVISHAPFEQLIYINKCLVLSLSQNQKPEQFKHLLGEIMKGIGNYLKSSLARVRSLGSAAGQFICNTINPEQSSSLQLPGCDHDCAAFDTLIASFKSQAVDDVEKMRSVDEDLANVTHLHATIRVDKESAVEDKNGGKGVEEVDSDDDEADLDLIAYLDEKNNQVLPAGDEAQLCGFYIQDILSHLSVIPAVSKNTCPELFEQALAAAAQVILRADATAVSECWQQLANVLLELEDKFTTARFDSLRVEALSALIVRMPIEVGPHLTSLFYQPDCSLRLRLDVLQAVRAGVEQLSNQSSSKEASSFGAVCGYLFFPLLTNVDKPVKSLDLMGDDSVVLSNLLYTTALVLHHSNSSASVTAKAKSNMAKTLVAEVCMDAEIHGHKDAAVRQSVWFCVLVALQSMSSLSSHFSTSGGGVNFDHCEEALMHSISFFHSLAQTAAQQDPHSECRQLAHLLLSSSQTPSRHRPSIRF